MKALVFGGAFNPPSIAHIDMAYHAKLETKNDYVIFVPSKSKYIKDDQGKDFAFSEEERLMFLEEIAKHHEWMKVSDLEIRQENQPRTYFTLKALQTQTKDDLTLLFGSDKLLELETGWRYVDEMGKEFGFAVMTRSHDDILGMMKNPYLEERKSYFTFISPLESYQNISSTIIRQKIRNHENIHGLVPKEIESLLNKEGK